MNVPQDDLNLWRRFATDLRTTMARARLALAGKRFGEVDGLLEHTEGAALRMGKRLDQAGAEKPTDADGRRPALRHETPLELLDTAKNRRYADALRAAWEAGLAVDRERYGSDIGTDGPAGALQLLLIETETEIYGPAGRGEGIERRL